MATKKTIKVKQLAQYRLTKILVGLEKQALLAYKIVSAKMVADLVRQMKVERLIKSGDEIKRGWTGEVARIEIDVDALLAPSMTKYFDALRWVMLGNAAGKDAREAAKTVGISKMVKPGLIQGAYLASIDAQRDHFTEVTGESAHDMPAQLLKESLDEIFNRSIRFVNQMADQLKNSMLAAVEQSAQSQNMKNLQAAHAAIHEDEPIEDAIEGIKATDLKTDLEAVAEQFESKWDLMGRAGIGQAAAVGAHQAMIEVAGRKFNKLRIVNIEMQDEKTCSFCHKVSKNPDGSWIYYDSDELKPAGYNFSQKRANWAISYAPLHHRCFSSDMYVLTDGGWKKWPEVTGTERFLSVNIETGNAEWVSAIRLVKYHYCGSLDWFHSNNANFATTPNHTHVMKHRIKNRGRVDAGKWIFVNGEDVPRHDAAFLATIPNWSGLDSKELVVAGRSFNSLSFCRMMAIFLSKGSVSKNRNRLELKISQTKYADEFYEIYSRIFPKIWLGREAFYVPFDRDDEFANWLMSFGKSWEKSIPTEIKELSTAHILEFLKYYRMGDGSEHVSRPLPGCESGTVTNVYFTSSHKMMSDLSELIMKIGKRPSFVLDEAKICRHRNGDYLTKHPCWRIRECKSGVQSLSSVVKESMPYCDFVYDVELEKNHTLIVSRQGRVVVSGNCRCQSVLVPDGFTVKKNGTLEKA